jgi:hypothetical protein
MKGQGEYPEDSPNRLQKLPRGVVDSQEVIRRTNEEKRQMQFSSLIYEQETRWTKLSEAQRNSEI